MNHQRLWIGLTTAFALSFGAPIIHACNSETADFVVTDNASWLRMFVIRCLFDDIGGAAVNHYHVYGGSTYIIGCTGHDTGRTNMLTAEEVKAGIVQDDRGPILGFGTHATENRTRTIYQINNSWQGRGSGIERVAFHDPRGFRQVGSHNAKFGFPHDDKPKGPRELYEVATDPKYADTELKDFRPRRDSPLLNAGTTKFDGVPEYDPLGEPVFDQLDVYKTAIPKFARPLIGAVAPE